MADQDDDEVNPVAVQRSANFLLAKEIQAGKIKACTRSAYQRKVEILNQFLKSSHPNYYDSEKEICKLPLPADILAEFMATISIVKDKKTKVMKQASCAHVGGYRSAIVDLYKSNNLKFDDDAVIGMSDFSSGYKRLVAEKKLTGEMVVQEGKSPITFGGYNFVAEHAMTMKEDFQQSMFAHLFLLLCWNLIARSVSVGTIMLQHISWEQDAMVITTPKHKGDQEGNNCYPKHVYANPVNPTICPILSMALLIFGGGWQRSGAKHMLLRGTATEGRFSKWLKGIMNSNGASMIALGIIAFDIGTHSFRKGVATFVAGCVAGPSAISIFLRAGWSLGVVTSRYIFTGQGGDQVTC